MARIMNWFDAVYNHVIATWAEQSQFLAAMKIVFSSLFFQWIAKECIFLTVHGDLVKF
jgi:hypothetical protein